MDLVVDPFGTPLWSPPIPAWGLPGGAGIGMRHAEPLPIRMAWVMAGPRRYEPSHPPGEQCLFGMDFSFLLPMGVGINFADLKIFNNTFLSPDVSADFIIDPVTIAGRVVWTRLQGGVDGTDYRFLWSVTDSDGFVWPRTALVLCSATN